MYVYVYVCVRWNMYILNTLDPNNQFSDDLIYNIAAQPVDQLCQKKVSWVLGASKFMCI